MDERTPAPTSAAPRSRPPRLYLSPPHLAGSELPLVEEALADGWIGPLGPHLEAFEREVAELLGVAAAAAVSSGTAALHLALRLAGVQPADEVLCSSFTFVGGVSPVLMEGARPVFLDSDESSWNLDPNLLEEELRSCGRRGRPPAALIVTDVLGQCADYGPILELCARYGVPLIEDAAEALGATCRGKPAGSFGLAGALSFNGNKIVTCGGGGMVVSDDPALVREARFLATQARDPAPHYQHSRLGYNYRLSSVLAALGRGQLPHLAEFVRRRRAHFEAYRAGLEGLPGLGFMPEAPYGRCTRWLTCLQIDPEAFGATPAELAAALEAENIEARPVWKPMHLQPLFQGCRVRGGAVSERIFARGLCLPSGSGLTRTDLERVIAVVRKSCREPRL